ncbi:hypothetical protein EES46_29680 [Streptomyces sp. ADI98-10]|nr:hypothetical protein EES46_29680 [Streptomyces sp. ADI98-10]
MGPFPDGLGPGRSFGRSRPGFGLGSGLGVGPLFFRSMFGVSRRLGLFLKSVPFFRKLPSKLLTMSFANLSRMLVKKPAAAPNAAALPMSLQSMPSGRRPFGAKFIIASRTAKVVNASANASVREGARCSRWSRWLSVVRMKKRLRSLAIMIWLAEAPPVKKDIAR